MKIYDNAHKNNYRYALGDKGKNTLFVFGVNPSTATDKFLDPTIRNVKIFSDILKFDSFVMLNLYPLRATNPKELPVKHDEKQHQKNLYYIKKYMVINPTIWCAWGNLIESRDYLKACLYDIKKSLSRYKPEWIKYGNLTKLGHPQHPVRKRHTNLFNEFDIAQYEQQLKKVR